MKNNINKNKFTLLDLIICILVLSVAVYFGIRLFSVDKNGQEYNVIYKVTLTMENSQIQNLTVGDKILTSDGENAIGEITDISFVDATETYYFISERTVLSSENYNASSAETELETATNIVATSSDSEHNNSFDNEERNFSGAETDPENESGETDAPSEYPVSSTEEILPTEPFVEKDEIPISGYSFVTITISAKLEKGAMQYFLNNQPLTIGSDVEVTTQKYNAVGKCAAISNFTSEQQESAE